MGNGHLDDSKGIGMLNNRETVEYLVYLRNENQMEKKESVH